VKMLEAQEGADSRMNQLEERLEVTVRGGGRAEATLQELNNVVCEHSNALVDLIPIPKNIRIIELMTGTVHHNVNDLRNEVEEVQGKLGEDLQSTCESVVRQIVSPLVMDINAMKASWDVKCNHLKMMENAIWESVVMHQKKDTDTQSDTLSPLHQALAQMDMTVSDITSMSIPNMFQLAEEDEVDESARPYNGAADGSGNVPPKEEEEEEEENIADYFTKMIVG